MKEELTQQKLRLHCYEFHHLSPSRKPGNKCDIWFHSGPNHLLIFKSLNLNLEEIHLPFGQVEDRAHINDSLWLFLKYENNRIIWILLPSRPGLRPVSLFTDPSQANEDFPEFLNETPVTDKLVLLWEIRSLAGKDFKMSNFGINLTSHRLSKMMLKTSSEKPSHLLTPVCKTDMPLLATQPIIWTECLKQQSTSNCSLRI